MASTSTGITSGPLNVCMMVSMLALKIRKVMKNMAGKGMRERMRMMQELQQGGLMNPGAKLGKPKQGTGKRLTPEEKRKMKKQREKEARRRKYEEKHGDKKGKDQNGKPKDEE